MPTVTLPLPTSDRLGVEDIHGLADKVEFSGLLCPNLMT